MNLKPVMKALGPGKVKLVPPVFDEDYHCVVGSTKT